MSWATTCLVCQEPKGHQLSLPQRVISCICPSLLGLGNAKQKTDTYCRWLVSWDSAINCPRDAGLSRLLLLEEANWMLLPSLPFWNSHDYLVGRVVVGGVWAGKEELTTDHQKAQYPPYHSHYAQLLSTCPAMLFLRWCQVQEVASQVVAASVTRLLNGF